MGQDVSPLGSLPTGASACRLVVRKEERPSESLQFVIAGLEMGQQVVVLGGAEYLKDLAVSLNQTGLRPNALLRNGRLVFLTAPECFSQLSHPDEILQRGPLRRNVSVMRWVTDWSWAYANGTHPGSVLKYQCRVHDFVRSLTGLSLCTVHCGKLERTSLLAMLADHRRAQRAPSRPA